LVADGAHNVYSIDSLLRSLPRYFDFDRLLLIVGFSRDKNVEDMARSLGRAADRVYAAASRHPRSLKAPELARLFEREGAAATAAGPPGEALAQAMNEAGERDIILATGSLFLAAEVREAALGIEPEVYPELMAGN
jgi:dihydrofolate synthase/folylpolyglutamate synthase